MIKKQILNLGKNFKRNKMWNDLEEFILELAIENSKKTGEKTKIVEIGVGRFQTISKNLSQNENIELVMTDISPANEDIIEDDVFIGVNTIICNSVRIGKGAIVGAGSVVTKDIPPYQVWAGNPARFIKERAH